MALASWFTALPATGAADRTSIFPNTSPYRAAFHPATLTRRLPAARRICGGPGGSGLSCRRPARCGRARRDVARIGGRWPHGVSRTWATGLDADVRADGGGGAGRTRGGSRARGGLGGGAAHLARRARSRVHRGRDCPTAAVAEPRARLAGDRADATRAARLVAPASPWRAGNSAEDVGATGASGASAERESARGRALPGRACWLARAGARRRGA